MYISVYVFLCGLSRPSTSMGPVGMHNFIPQPKSLGNKYFSMWSEQTACMSWPSQRQHLSAESAAESVTLCHQLNSISSCFISDLGLLADLRLFFVFGFGSRAGVTFAQKPKL
jgi:hypothetical protein